MRALVPLVVLNHPKTYSATRTGRQGHAWCYLMGHSVWSFCILLIGIGLKGINYVTAEVDEEIEAYLMNSCTNYTDDTDDHRRSRRLDGELWPTTRRLEGWAIQDYEDNQHRYLDMVHSLAHEHKPFAISGPYSTHTTAHTLFKVCWGVFCHLLFGNVLHSTTPHPVPFTRLWIGRILPTVFSSVLFWVPDFHLQVYKGAVCWSTPALGASLRSRLDK